MGLMLWGCYYTNYLNSLASLLFEKIIFFRTKYKLTERSLEAQMKNKKNTGKKIFLN